MKDEPRLVQRLGVWLPVLERFFHQGLVNRQLGAGVGCRVILRIRDLFRDRVGLAAQLGVVNDRGLGEGSCLGAVLVRVLEVVGVLAHEDADELAAQILLAQDGGTLAQPADREDNEEGDT